jgi:hypothetical protein
MFLVSTARPVRKADNLSAICEPIGIHGLLRGYLYFLIKSFRCVLQLKENILTLSD